MQIKLASPSRKQQTTIIFLFLISFVISNVCSFTPCSYPTTTIITTRRKSTSSTTTSCIHSSKSSSCNHDVRNNKDNNGKDDHIFHRRSFLKQTASAIAFMATTTTKKKTTSSLSVAPHHSTHPASPPSSCHLKNMNIDNDLLHSLSCNMINDDNEYNNITNINDTMTQLQNVKKSADICAKVHGIYEVFKHYKNNSDHSSNSSTIMTMMKEKMDWKEAAEFIFDDVVKGVLDDENNDNGDDHVKILKEMTRISNKIVDDINDHDNQRRTQKRTRQQLVSHILNQFVLEDDDVKKYLMKESHDSWMNIVNLMN